MSERSLVVGVDLGGTHMQAGVVDARGEIVGRSSGKTLAPEGFEAVVGRIAGRVREACGEAGVGLEDIAAVGVGAPGALDLAGRVVLEAPNLQWENAPLADALGKALGGVRVVLENDVNAAVLGEAEYGAAKGGEDVFGVWIGTGIGGGIVLDGKVFRGSLGTAGEFGRMIVHEDGRCLEDFASRKSMDKRIRQKRGEAEGDAIPSSEIARLYREGDTVVREVVDDAVGLIGRQIANQLTALSVGTIVIGGGIVEEMGPEIHRVIQQRILQDTFPKDVGSRVKLVCTELRENAGVLGAAAVARGSLKESEVGG